MTTPSWQVRFELKTCTAAKITTAIPAKAIGVAVVYSVGDAGETIYLVLESRAGSLRDFCRVLGQRRLTEFSSRLADPSFAHIFVGVQISDRQDTELLMASLEAAGLPCHDLTDNELAKLHLCHMVGGRLPASAGAALEQGQELLYRFEFPERPGALMAFVSSLHPNWNISIFHYRNHGADVGRIVVGVQVPEGEVGAWQEFLAALPYQHWEETHNPAYRLFLGPAARLPSAPGLVGV